MYALSSGSGHRGHVEHLSSLSSCTASDLGLCASLHAPEAQQPPTRARTFGGSRARGARGSREGGAELHSVLIRSWCFPWPKTKKKPNGFTRSMEHPWPGCRTVSLPGCLAAYFRGHSARALICFALCKAVSAAGRRALQRPARHSQAIFDSGTGSCIWNFRNWS